MTYSLMLVDRERAVIGVATASKSLAVGHGVPALDPAIGAMVTQAWTHRELRATVLAAAASGASAGDALERSLADDGGRQFRQVGLALFNGELAVATGTETTGWAGSSHGDGLLVLGNYLAGPGVLDAMVSAVGIDTDLPSAIPRPVVDVDGQPNERPFSEAVVSMTHRLVAALVAGQCAGGDRRGQQSVALMVSHQRPATLHPPEIDVDLRVDSSPEPLLELDRLVREQFWNDDAPSPPTLAQLADRLGVATPRTG